MITNIVIVALLAAILVVDCFLVLRRREPELTVRQNEDETLHLTLSREEQEEPVEYEYRVERMWTGPANDTFEKKSNDEEINKLLKDGWEPYLLAGCDLTEGWKRALMVSTVALRRPKKQEVAA